MHFPFCISLTVPFFNPQFIIMVNTIGFTSLLESSYGKLPVISNNLINGIRIRYNDSWYLVGQACKELGRNPHRLVNATPDELDYRVLFQAALLAASTKNNQSISLSFGFPFSTQNLYRPLAEKLAEEKRFLIEYDSATFKKDGNTEKISIDINNFEVIPELVACVIGLKKHYNIKETNFLLISLGFGTIEIGVVTPDGLNGRTVISVPGIIQCIKNARYELERDHFMGFMTDHQLDEAFIKGSVILNRTVVNFTSMRNNILRAFYKEYISDTIKGYISDRDFEKIEKIYICGGGIRYEEIQNCFKNEFEKVLPVEFVANPDTLASKGYYYNAERISHAAHGVDAVVGIDLGNSSTYITTNKDTEY